MDGVRQRGVLTEQRTSISESTNNTPYFHGEWTIHHFTSKKRPDLETDKKLSKELRNFYKAQNELIGTFEALTHQDADGTEASTQAERTRSARLLAQVTFFLNFLILIAKSVAAALSGSLSIISALIDSIFDLVSGGLMWWSDRAVRNTDPYRYPEGRAKLEPMAIVVLSVVMGLSSVQMIRESAERIINIASGKDTLLSMDNIIIGICCFTIVTKFILYIVCIRVDNPKTRVLAQDHRNDVFSNSIALAGGLIGAKYWSYADPVGAVLISAYIVLSWYYTGWEQVEMLTGQTAPPEFMKKVTWIAMNHHPRIRQIETVRAYHSGNNFLVEIHIVLDEELPLKQTHDIGESLQQRLEKFEEVEKAFVHIDYDADHEDR